MIKLSKGIPSFHLKPVRELLGKDLTGDKAVYVIAISGACSKEKYFLLHILHAYITYYAEV